MEIGIRPSGIISIHALLAESDPPNYCPLHPHHISIHALLAESDPSLMPNILLVWAFLSTLSLRRATAIGRRDRALRDISIHALLAESDPAAWRRSPSMPPFLSTLSLRRATLVTTHADNRACISIHALLAESDPQPPPSSRRLTNFYPRSPCGERRQ